MIDLAILGADEPASLQRVFLATLLSFGLSQSISVTASRSRVNSRPSLGGASTVSKISRAPATTGAGGPLRAGMSSRTGSDVCRKIAT